MKGWRFVAPALIVMAVVTGWPLGRALYESLFRTQSTTPDDRSFVLFDNYGALLTSPTWWRAVALILGLMTVTIVIQLILGLGFAGVLRQVLHLSLPVRVLILGPFAVMAFGSAFAWRDAVTTGYLATWFRLGDFGESAAGTLTIILLTEIWRGTGIVALILFAGMQNAPARLLESAAADGATSRQRLFRVVLPAVWPAMCVAIAYRVADSFAMFDPVFAAAGAGPSADVSVPSTLIFDAAISRFEIGLGSAMSILLVLTAGIVAYAFRAALRVRRPA